MDHITSRRGLLAATTGMGALLMLQGKSGSVEIVAGNVTGKGQKMDPSNKDYEVKKISSTTHRIEFKTKDSIPVVTVSPLALEVPNGTCTITGLGKGFVEVEADNEELVDGLPNLDKPSQPLGFSFIAILASGKDSVPYLEDLR